MRILVINGGSSSVKFSIFSAEDPGLEPRSLLEGEVTGIGKQQATLKVGEDRSDVSAETEAEATRCVFDAVGKSNEAPPAAVGYRVVHPGPRLRDHQRITPEVLRDLEAAIPFAPLHDPGTLALIREGLSRFPAIPHYACFDTVFHQTMPEEATIYAIPAAFRDAGVRRYGFHGLSCESIVRRLQGQGAGIPRRMVIAHLGSGCSVTALMNGCSVDTTMGLTPTGGVLMGTRPGDLDPGLVLYLLRQQPELHAKEAIDEVEHMLNHEAGLVALSGMPNDVKALRQAAAGGNEQAALALKVFTRSITKAIGGFCWLLGGLEAIVFSGGIGEHDAATRSEVLAGLNPLGIIVNPALNKASESAMRSIGASDTKTSILVVPAEEDLMIAAHVQRMARAIPEP